MFEKASRLKFRFPSVKGQLTVEDLWDLPLLSVRGGACLDNVAKEISKEVKESEQESFVIQNNSVNETAALKLDIVKHIISVKISEAKAKEDLAAAKAKKEKLLNLISDKEDEVLRSSSIEDLKKMVEAL